MANIPIRLACGDYARVMPLAAGDVRADGIDLSLIRGEGGSWPIRADILRRVLSEPDLDGGESSMARHLRRVEQGDRSFVALPVFMIRGFVNRELYIRKDGPIRKPADLIGKRLGVYSWFASASVWHRHAQLAMGVPLDSVDWYVGYIEGAAEAVNIPDTTILPAGAQRAPAGRFLAEMLVAGDIDAMWSPPRPKLFDPENGPIVRLFPDARRAETQYFAKTGIFPLQHIVVIRREAWERNRWIARSLTDAFSAANAAFDASQSSFSDAYPWMEGELERTAALLGPDAYRDGLTDFNVKAVDAFLTQARDAGLIARPVSVEEYFAEFISSQAAT